MVERGAAVRDPGEVTDPDRTEDIFAEVSLAQILDARERRMRRQQELMRRYPDCALVCFTMNIAGPVKNSPLIQRGFFYGCELLRRQLLRFRRKPVFERVYGEATGNEGYFVIDLPPLTVKQLTTDLEDHEMAGRLFDMDVLCKGGRKLCRKELGLEARKCILCGQPAKICARSRAHDIEEIRKKTTLLLTECMRTRDLGAIARDACRALLYEVCTTPKPGLVDRNNRGSHRDMDIFTFMDSTAALYPYFRRCGEIGMDNREKTPEEVFSLLREEGIRAERSMFGITGGVNTHKGAIFSMGIVCAALGRLDHAYWSDPETVLRTCGELAAGITARDFRKTEEKVSSGAASEGLLTSGEKLYLRYGIRGVRGQAEDGFPAVLHAGLPALEKALEGGADINRAGSLALLAILGAVSDTNLIVRGGQEAQREMTAAVEKLLEDESGPSQERIEELDSLFMEKDLSPGGSADLLGLCFMLHFLRTEEG